MPVQTNNTLTGTRGIGILGTRAGRIDAFQPAINRVAGPVGEAPAIPYSSTLMRHIIAILLQNEAGALTRVAGLFSTRGYNIESLSVAPTDDPTVSRITLVTKGSDAVIQQIANQSLKLVDVLSVEDMTLGEHIERELVLLKLKVPPQLSDAVRGTVVRGGGRVLDPAPDGFIVELTANEAEVNDFIRELAARAELLEVARSGALGMLRTARPLKVVR
ncbi:MAG: acetolactate synthase small subunit [Steroidobacteraceae bacterium]